MSGTTDHVRDGGLLTAKVCAVVAGVNYRQWLAWALEEERRPAPVFGTDRVRYWKLYRPKILRWNRQPRWKPRRERS